PRDDVPTPRDRQVRRAVRDPEGAPRARLRADGAAGRLRARLRGRAGQLRRGAAEPKIHAHEEAAAREAAGGGEVIRRRRTTPPYKLWSVLLRYPDAALVEAREEIAAAVEMLPARQSLAAFTEYLAERDEVELAQAYGETFALRRRTSLYLTYYL